ncbi:MAG: spore coat associated protein CotJA [Oscillospiraceae bacterium]
MNFNQSTTVPKDFNELTQKYYNSLVLMNKGKSTMKGDKMQMDNTMNSNMPDKVDFENFINGINSNGNDKEKQNMMPEDKMRRFSLAMAYVPWQQFQNIYTGDVALARGTMFKELDFPLLREEVTPRER